MSDLIFWVRVAIFGWAFILFMGQIYYGYLDLYLSTKCSGEHLPPESHLWAAAALIGNFVLLFALGEAFVRDRPGGISTFLPLLYLAVITEALRQGAYRVQMHVISVQRGLCADPYGRREHKGHSHE